MVESALSARPAASADELALALGGLLLPVGDALPVAPATDRAVWDVVDGIVDRPALEDLVARATADLHEPWPVPLASDAARVHRDGDRATWEAAAFARQHRLSRAAVVAAATLDDRWLDQVADGVWLLCEQSSWCWPAHDDVRARHGSVLADVTDPFLDLGAGEAVAQLAWIDHLLAAPLDERYPGLRARIRHEARARVLAPFLARRDWHWLGLDGHVHNWNPWIHGNVLVAALQLEDDPRDRARLVAHVVEGLDRYVAGLPEDGAIDEGYGYWWNGALRALEALDVLRHATAHRVDAAPAVAALRETVSFPHRMHLGGDWYLNLADGQARPPADQPWHALHRAARRSGNEQALAHASSYRVPGRPSADESTGLGRLLRGLTEVDWLRAERTTPPLPRETWLPSTQVLVARERSGSASGLTLAAKGGHNGENHNHNDVGTFVVASDGVPVVVDAGRPTYTAQTFGPDRYAIWTMQSSWHNVPEVRGVAQAEGAHAAASDVTATATTDRAQLALELAAAYPGEAPSSWRRRVRLERTPHSRVVVEDAWDLPPWGGDGAEPATTLHLLLAGDVEVVPQGARVKPLDGATPVLVSWGDLPARTRVRTLDDPMLSDVWGERLTRVELDVTGLTTARVTVELDAPTTQDPR